MSDYTTLTDADLLAVARDSLRGLETDHYRLTLLGQSQADTDRAGVLAERITAVKEKIASLEASQPAPTTPDPKVAPSS